MRGLSALVLLLVVTVGCEEQTAPVRSDHQLVVPERTWPDEPEPSASDQCRQRIQALDAERVSFGAPRLMENRAEILGRARAEPLYFVRAPAEHPEGSQPKKALARLLAERDPALALVEFLRKNPSTEVRRAVLLREGYLYSDEPMLALRLSQVLRLDHLFDEREIVIERGTRTILARRKGDRYFVLSESPSTQAEAPAVSAPEGASSRARAAIEQDDPLEHAPEAALLLFDRVRVSGESPSAPLGVDFGALRRELAFDRAEVTGLVAAPSEAKGAAQTASEAKGAGPSASGAKLVMRLSTGNIESEALVRVSERGATELECEATPPDHERQLAEQRAQNRRAEELVDPILSVARRIVSERLPFDEPRTEFGQEDGQLRIAFKKAYHSYQETYEYNGDRYFVFDGAGRPRVPEVCIDFITDSFDWATGGGFPPRGEKRLYRAGALRFASFGLENSRSVERMATFADQHPDWFDMVWLSDAERVKFYKRREFFEVLDRTSARYRRGDVVFILGLRSDERFHYHSFFVDRVDPLTGVPILLAANAGPPQIRTWEGEMQNAPLRSIVARMRVRPELLERAYAQARERPGVPLDAPPARLLPEPAIEVEGIAASAAPSGDSVRADEARHGLPHEGERAKPSERPLGEIRPVESLP